MGSGPIRGQGADQAEEKGDGGGGWAAGARGRRPHVRFGSLQPHIQSHSPYTQLYSVAGTYFHSS